jgi:hypothetical protein
MTYNACRILIKQTVGFDAAAEGRAYGMGVDKLQPLRSKWLKTKLIINNESIKPFIPDTQKFNKTNLKSMMS